MENKIRETAEDQDMEYSLDQLLHQVEGCISVLEKPEVSLEESFRSYEEGIRKLKACHAKVAQIEQKMVILDTEEE